MTAQDLTMPVSEMNGIGPERAKTLAELGVHTVEDLLFYFPFRYDHYEIKDLSQVAHNEKTTIIGKVHGEPSLSFYGRKKSRLTVRLLVDRYLVKAVWFNQPFAKKQLNVGDEITVTGKWDLHRKTITAAEWKKGRRTGDAIAPVYSVKANVTVKQLRKIIAAAWRQYGRAIPEVLPDSLLKTYRLAARAEAVRAMHFPKNHKEIRLARRRLVYEELLLFQLKMQMFKKIRRERSGGVAMRFKEEDVRRFAAGLPFSLTDAQQRVTQEILQDMCRNQRMNRLLQGDVGSGKTVVAAIALYAAVRAGFQGALMVPTEILAEQHAASLHDLLTPQGVRVAVLTSSVKGNVRKTMMRALESGEIDVVIGTHALIQNEVRFHRLGLAITDEQHRFGVMQRRHLTSKGHSPDVLYMTATPIPRTLALSLYGDMDVSTIDQMPAGRQPIETYWAKPEMFSRVLRFVKREIAHDHQAYVICPLIEESDKLDVQNAIDVHAQIANEFSGTGINVGLLHGRMSADEKEAVMEAFAANRCHVLVSTTVVEVGVDVPNATVMVVYDAERFGLSQLHQLRGRVGRGNAQSYCLLLADPKSENGKQRMRIMTETNDGFRLSEEDLKLRGAGDFFGSAQSGLPAFKLADLNHDYRTLKAAREDAAKLVEQPAFWTDKDYASLRRYLEDSGALQLEKID
ncbi:MAG TPA: ATP-dependent DNA helicase RecG [Bacillales bacterium]|nr:ATP-dependent DNA helicase RecG [Bacillales bacterium]